MQNINMESMRSLDISNTISSTNGLKVGNLFDLPKEELGEIEWNFWFYPAQQFSGLLTNKIYSNS